MVEEVLINLGEFNFLVGIMVLEIKGVTCPENEILIIFGGTSLPPQTSSLIIGIGK